MFYCNHRKTMPVLKVYNYWNRADVISLSQPQIQKSRVLVKENDVTAAQIPFDENVNAFYHENPGPNFVENFIVKNNLSIIFPIRIVTKKNTDYLWTTMT